MKYYLQQSLIVYVALASACSSIPQQPQHVDRGDYSVLKESASALIAEKMIEYDIVGMSIAVVDDQKIVWSEGFGWADESSSIPATANTVYRTGSVTKLFTATAAMQQYEKGQLDINAPIQSYIPGLSYQTHHQGDKQVTARNIMTHQSGLPTDHIHGMWTDQAGDASDLVTALSSDYLANSPDEVLSYSNIGMSVLGLAIENISRTDYESYVHQNILQPIGMDQSYISKSIKQDKSHSLGYKINRVRLD